MSSITIGRLPRELVVKILQKIKFREAARMRRTCRQIDELIHLNAARFKFSIRGANLIYQAYTTHIELIDQKLNNGRKSPPPYVKHHPRGLECAVFDRIDISCYFIRHRMEPDFTQFMQENNIRCRHLNVVSSIRSSINLVPLYTACGATALSLSCPSSGYDFTLDHMSQLADLGCKSLSIAHCPEFPSECYDCPSNYLDIFSRFESLCLQHHGQLRRHSLTPIIKKMMTAPPQMALRYLEFPFATCFATKTEVEELELQKWRFDIRKHTESFEARFNFIFETPNDYLTLHRPIQTAIWAIERISRSNIGEFVTKWATYYLGDRIPYDLSGLFDFIRMNQDDFDLIKERLMQLVDHAYSYPSIMKKYV